MKKLKKVRFLQNYGDFLKNTYRAIVGETDTHYVILNSSSGTIEDVSELAKPLRGKIYEIVERS